MYRRRRYTRARKAKRPTDRVIRAGTTGPITPGTQADAYVFEADTPCTTVNFKLDCGANTNSATLAYALVYVPEGYNINTINYPAVTDDLYNPTKNVLISGILTDQEMQDHKYSRIGRKMATGDRIALIFYNWNTISVSHQASFELSFTTMY